MPIEVEAPDGTVIEFPDGTAPETIKGVMAKQFGGPSAPSKAVASWQGDKYQAEYDVPQDATDEQVKQASLDALRAKYPGVQFPDGGEVSRRDPVALLGDTAKDFATNVSSGFYSGIDFLANTNPVQMAMQGLGAPKSDLAGFINSLNPNAQNAPTAGLQQFYGAALLPVPGGAAAPKFGLNALGRAEGAPAQNALASVAAKDVGLIPNAEKVVADGIANKVPVFRTDLKPPKTRLGQGVRLIGENIWLAGTGGKRAGQQQARIEAVERIASEYGADDLSNIGETAQAATNAVTKAFAERRAKDLGQLTAVKQQVLEGTGGAVEAPRAIAEIDRQIARLDGINSEAFAPIVAKLESFKGQLAGGKSLAEIEGNRKLLGDLFADPSLASIKGDGQKALNAIYGPLREDMASFITANAGEGVAARFKNANDRLAAMAGELSDAKFKRVLKTADASPEEVAKLIFSKKPSDVTRLVANLDDAGRAKAEAAIVLEAVKRATTDGVVSPQKFATAMEAMKNATRLMAGGEKSARLEGLSRVIKATQHASEAAAFPITGAQLTPMAATGGLATILGPVFGSMTVPAVATAGIFARLYENKLPAQLLGQLGKAKPGSKAEAAIGARLAPHIAKLLPAAANDAKPMPMSPGAAAAQGDEPQN